MVCRWWMILVKALVWYLLNEDRRCHEWDGTTTHSDYTSSTPYSITDYPWLIVLVVLVGCRRPFRGTSCKEGDLCWERLLLITTRSHYDSQGCFVFTGQVLR